MDIAKEKKVRVHPVVKQNCNALWERTDSPGLQTPSPLYKASASPMKSNGHGRGKGGVRSKITGVLKLGWSKVFPNEHKLWKKKILDPEGDIVFQWKRFFMFSSLVALITDPVFFYLPVINGEGYTCLKMDLSLRIVLTYIRTITDLLYLLHILIKFQTAYIAPTSRGLGRGQLVRDYKRIARRYLCSDFFVDVAAALPFPQVFVWLILPEIRSSHGDHHDYALLFIVLVQYFPRLYQFFPLGSEIVKATGVNSKSAWAGAVYNLLLYLITSHVFGAAWYLLAIERYTTCLKSECKNEVGPLKCSLSYLDCGSLQNNNRTIWENNTVVFNNCDASNQNITFNYGVFAYALTSNVGSLKKFPPEICLLLLVGLAKCENFFPSPFIGETIYISVLAGMGLVLFAHFIGNVQTYLASTTARLEEWRLKRRDTEEWMRHRQLPQDLRERVQKFVQYKWLATRGADEGAILRTLPTDIRRDIQRYLCLDLVRRVPFFAQMDDQLLDAICDCLVSSLSTKGTCIVREGDPVSKMLFIIRGKLESSTTFGGKAGFFNSITLKPGDFCGEELLAWALLPKSTVSLPSSTRTVRALGEVEAFALQAEDLKFVANRFRRLHSKKLQHTFRFYSHHWRTWAACFLQAAWRQYKRRKIAKELFMEDTLSSSYPLHDQAAVVTGQNKDLSTASTCPSRLKQDLEVTMLSSRFSTSRRMGAQTIKGVEIPLQKPEDSKYITEQDDD